MEKYRILEHAIKLYDEQKENMSTKEQLQYAKLFIDFALNASPKSVQHEGVGTKIELIIGGIKSGRIDGNSRPLEEIVQHQEPVAELPSPVPRALPEPVHDSRARQPYSPSSRPRPAIDVSPPSVPDAFAVRAPYGPPEKSVVPQEWQTPLYPVED